MYDFDTLRPRLGVDSEKWNSALEEGCPPGVVPLTVADMEFASPPEVVAGLRELAGYGMWGYTCAGDTFRQSVLDWMRARHGWQGEAGWMVHTQGIVQLLYVAVRALTATGDGVVVQPPVYPPFYQAVEHTGRVVVENPLVVQNGRYEMDFEDLAHKLQGAKLMLLCSPHNPVGRVWRPDEIERVATLCAEAGVVLVSDEIHCDLVMPGHTHFSAGRLAPHLLQNCVVATSASKSFSLAGLGCSTTFVPCDEKRRAITRRLRQDGFGFNTAFGTAATRIAYTSAAGWLNALLDYLWANYRYLAGRLAQDMPKIRPGALEGTYLAWLDFSALGLGGDGLVDFLHQRAALWLNDGRMFRAGGEGFARMNLACPRSVLADALDRLQAALHENGLL